MSGETKIGDFCYSIGTLSNGKLTDVDDAINHVRMGSDVGRSLYNILEKAYEIAGACGKSKGQNMDST